MESIVSDAPSLPARSEPQGSAPAVAPQPSVEQFRFTGNAAEYFGIWIVNLFLSVVTVGIYSAWAKVRRKRYFYGNTWVADANFEYHGDPIAILKGRIVAFVLFVSYTVGGYFSPKIAAGIAIAVMPFIPWLLVRSFAFNAVNSSHRNLRFHFRAGYRDALKALWPLAILPVLYLFMPDMHARTKESREIEWTTWVLIFLPTVVFFLIYPAVVARIAMLRIDNSYFGTARFATTVRVRQFYAIYARALLLILAMVGVIWAAVAALVSALSSVAKDPMVMMGLLPLIPVAYLAFGAILFAFTQSRVHNLTFNRTSLAERVTFESKLSARRLAVLYATNILAIVCSLGLLVPWAVIRVAKYRAEVLTLACPEGLEAFAADTAADVTAAGEEIGEMFDIDLSL